MVGAVASTITKITSVEQLIAYLTEAGYDPAEYMAEGGRAILRWYGSGAAAVGLVGEAEVDAAGAVLRGVDPEALNGGRLVMARNPKSVMGYEISFAPPKSVSALWAIADDSVREEISGAVEVAIGAAVRVLDERVAWTRRRGGEGVMRWVRGEGLLAMAVRHESSRAGDPQLHDHVLIANMVRAEKKWGTLDGERLYDARPLATTAYGRVLQRELTRRLGAAWTPPAGKNSVREIAGVPTVLTDLWSRRHAEIVAAVAELAATSPTTSIGGGAGSRRVAAAHTRATKDLSESPTPEAGAWAG